MARLTCVLTVGLVLLTGPAARGQLWTGPGTDWNTANNWSPTTIPNSSTAAVVFAGDGVGTVNISSSVAAQSLTFTNPNGGYFLSSSAGMSLFSLASINVSAGVTSSNTFNMAPNTAGNLLFASGGNLTVTDNGPSDSSLYFSSNNVIGTPGSGAVVFGGTGATTYAGSFATTGGHSVVGGLKKSGQGTLAFSGSGAALTGGISLTGGTLVLDYSGNTASKLNGGGLTLNGGVLQVVPNAATAVTQSIPGGTNFFTGHTDILATGTGTATLALGSASRGVTATADFSPSASNPSFSVTTTTGNTNGLLGNGFAWATYGGGSTWAASLLNNVTGVAVFGTNTFGPSVNVDVSGSPTPAANFTANSLRFNGPDATQTLTLTGTNTLQSGGILATPNAGTVVITGGTLMAISGSELIVHQYAPAPMVINSTIASTVGLTKTGTGTLTLGGNNTGLTGTIYINRGGLTVTNPAAVNSANGIYFTDARLNVDSFGLQRFGVDLGNGVNGTITPPINASPGGAAGYYGMYFSNGNSSNSRVTLGGVLSSYPGLVTPIRFIGSSNDTSGFNLTNVNTFTGDVQLYDGYLGINADAALGNPANTLILDVGNPQAGGLEFLTTGVTINRPVRLAFQTRIISNGTDTNTIASPLTGGAGFIKDGAGTLVLSNSNNNFTGPVTVAGGTLSLGSTGQLPYNTNVTVNAGGTFTPGTSNNDSFTPWGTLTLNGGTFRVSSPAAQFNTLNKIVVGPGGGTIDYTGAASAGLYLYGPGAAITVNGNATWLSPANTAKVINYTNGELAVTIAPGVTLTDGIALYQSPFQSGFVHLLGGGTLFQNSDTTNVAGMNAPITVTQSRFRVVDASGNGGVGNFGAGVFTLDGGTFAYGGPTATTAKRINLTANGGTIEVESPATVLTLGESVFGLGGLTKVGPGTLNPTNPNSTFNGLTINAGVVATANDATLGTGPVTVNPAGTLRYTASTSSSRAYTLVFGSLEVLSGATLTLNGGAINGGYVVGSGGLTVTGGTALTGVTTYASTAINVSGSASFTNYTNGSPLTVTTGLAGPTNLTHFVNQGSGTVTVAAGSQVNAADIQTYGTLTIAPSTSGPATQLTNVGTSPLYFNGGSRTFVSDVAHIGGPAYVDIHGQDAIVAGGLFVNNGAVFDSLASPAGHHNLIADYGATIKGAGLFQFTPVTQNGGKFSPGNSPGAASFGEFKVGQGGVSNYVFQIDDATGTAGPTPDGQGHVSGWDLAKAVQTPVGSTATPADFVWGADSAHPLTVAIDTLVNPTTIGTDVAGPMDHFDLSLAYSWTAVEWTGAYTGPANVAALDATTAFDTSGIVNAFSGSFGWQFGPDGHSLDLTYTPVPEPGTLLLVGAASLGLGWVRRRKAAR
jgi:fibronectin-binding autotransporter adhesin